jgi:hypothetical protein
MLWATGGKGFTVAAIDEVIARKQAAAAWLQRRATLLTCILVAFAVGQSALVSLFGGGPKATVLSFVGALYLCIFGRMAIENLYNLGEDVDLALAHRLRRTLRHETENIARLRARAARKEAFALYLRSFGAPWSGKPDGC